MNFRKFIFFIFSLYLYKASIASTSNTPLAQTYTVQPNIIVSHESKDCGLCHRPQYAQWKGSWHAKAASPGLIGQLALFEQETIKDCLNCHSPRKDPDSINLTDDLKANPGVDCASCHIRGQQRFGPKNVKLTPHGSVHADPLFSQSQFCLPCHQFGEDGIKVNGKPLENTFEEWQKSRYATEGKTCQHCHMPAKAHEFKGIHDRDMVRSGLLVKVFRKKQTFEIHLTNRGAGHALPTYITPKIRVIWTGDNGVNLQLASIQRKMNWQAKTGWSEIFDTRLMPDENRVIIKKLPEGSAGYIEVWVDPDADYTERVYPAIIKIMNESSTENLAVRQVQKALMSGLKSSYRLYQFRCEAGEGFECK